MGIIKKTYKKIFGIVFVIVFIAFTIMIGKIIFDSVYPRAFDESEISQPKQQQTETTEIPTLPEATSPIKVQWAQLNSPPGGGYWSIAIAPSDPNTILIASRDFNILKTTNGGNNWNLLGEKLFGAHIFSNIVIHPSDANRIMISNGALYYTKDGGTVWYAVNTYGNVQIGSGETEGVTALAVDDNNPNTIYAGQGNEFYQSSDFGKTWKKLSEVSEIVGSTIRGIIVVSDSIYVMNSGSGLWKSDDNGKTFASIEEVSSVDFTYRYLFHDKTGNNIYVAAVDALYKNSGGSWNMLPGFNSEIQPIAVSAAGNIVYVTATDKSVYKSQDGGNSWAKVLTVNNIQSHHDYNFPVAVHPDFPDIVYVATDRQILKSTDGGKTWRDIGKDVKDDSLFVMAYANDTNTLWVGAYWTRGLFITTDEGKNWKFIESWRSAEPQDHYPMSMVINPQDGKKVYVSGAFGVKITKDNGETWESTAQGTLPYGKHIHGLGIDKENPNILYAGTAPGWDQGYQTSKVFRTTDAGKTWKELSSFPSKEENNVYAFDAKGDVIYASINQHERSEVHAPHTNAQGVLKSVDRGETWQDISGNLPHKNIFPITTHPTNTDIIYAGLGHLEETVMGNMRVTKGDQGLFRKITGENKWEKVAGLPEVQPSKIRFHPSNSNIIFVSFGEHICGACAGEMDKDEYHYPKGAGLWGSVDGGNTWHNLVLEGTFTKRQMAVMDFIFVDDNTVYIITDDGLFKGEIEINS